MAVYAIVGAAAVILVLLVMLRWEWRLRTLAEYEFDGVVEERNQAYRWYDELGLSYDRYRAWARTTMLTAGRRIRELEEELAKHQDGTAPVPPGRGE